MNEINRSIFSGMQILVEKKWVHDQALVVENKLIKAIIPADMIAHHMPAKRYEYPPDHYLSPGFIDLHVHGAHGHDVMDGTEEALIAISKTLAAEGITGFLATTMTADKTHIERALTTIANTQPHQEGAAILGAHLEGPFIAKSKMGAQHGEDACLPDPSLMRHLQEVAKGTIKIVTLAPELVDSLQLIQLLRNMNVIVSIGHTNATYAETMAAIKAGCTQATHLFNAMRELHQREPGAVGALLLADTVNAELIVDNFHLHPAIVELAFRIKGKERLLLVTDAMRAKCLGNGQYELGGQLVDVQEGKATLNNGVLAGSTLRMPQAIRHMTQFSKCSLIDAITMAADNPAHVLKLDLHKGTIAVGKDADLVVLNGEFDVMMTMREGKEVYCR